jgi:type IV pilus assembly protein PilQ
MSVPSRLTMSAVLIAIGAILAHAAAPVPSVDQRKRDVVRDALRTLHRASPDWIVLQAGARAAALSSLAIDAAPDHTVLSLALDRPVLAHVAYPDPTTVVIDLHHAIPVAAALGSLPQQAAMTKLDIALHALEPLFVTRVTLRLAGPVHVTFTRTGIGIDVILRPMADPLEPGPQLALEVDRLLIQEQAQAAIRRAAIQELDERVRSMHFEHNRFLTQALEDLDAVVHQCKLVQVSHQLEAVTPAANPRARQPWEAQIGTLRTFVSESKQEQARLAQMLTAQRETAAQAREALSAQAEAACERYAAAAVTGAAMGALPAIHQQIQQVFQMHTLMYGAIVTDTQALAASLNTQLGSLRDHALARQEDARELLQQLMAAAPVRTAAAPAPATAGAAALQAILGTAAGIKAVPDLNLDLSHATGLLATLDETAAANAAASTPPGKRAPADLETVPADAVQEKSRVNSRMQSIFPEIGAPAAAVLEHNVQVFGAVGEVADAVDTTAPSYTGDPLDQLVNIDFREMELSHVVSILAKKAQINVIAGTDVTGTVTANLRNVPLRRAMEEALRNNGLGMIEEEGIYRIVPYEDAVAARRATRMLYLNNAQADEVKKTLTEVLVGSPDAALMSISANPSTNVVILSGPAATVDEFEQMVRNLDVAEPTLPTVTRAFRLNYAEPTDIARIVQSVISADVGQVAADTRSRQIIVTDIPIVIEQVAQIVSDVDLPVKQVAIEAMVVDAVLSDSARTGTEWVAQAIRRQNRRGDVIGNLSQLALDTDLGIGEAAVATLTFGIVSSDINIQAAIAAEVSSGDAKLLTNPQVVTIENQIAKISISQEIPYREIRQSEAGGTQTTTSFKEVGTVLEVMPRVTHEDDVIVKFDVKQSDTKGEFEGIPIEDKREAATTLRTRDGQTIFIGGLRKFDDTRNIRKVPFLGDIPVANFLFRSNINRTEVNELLIFLTCHVLQEHIPDLTPYQQMKYDQLGGTPLVPETERDVMGNIVHPGRVRDPFWKWRRQK